MRSRCLLCSAGSGLKQNACICHLSCNYSLRMLVSIKQDLFAHDLLPHDDMIYIWNLSAVLALLSWKELCVFLLSSPQLLFFFFFLLELWENHWDQRKYSWLTSSKKLIQMKMQSWCIGHNSNSKPLNALHHLVQPSAGRRLTVHCRLSIKQTNKKSR